MHPAPPPLPPRRPAPPAPVQVAERQGGELADAQRQVQALEAELQAKAQEGAALLADSLALKVRELEGWVAPGSWLRGLLADQPGPKPAAALHRERSPALTPLPTA